MGKEMRSKTLRYQIFGEVIYESLAAIYRLLEEKKRSYKLLAYVRKCEDRLEENIVHIQMQFGSTQERDTVWNQASQKLVENIQNGIKRATSLKEKLEIENILCAVRSDE